MDERDGVRERLRAATTREPVEPPAGLAASLRDYQRQGLTWLAEIGAHGVVAGPDSTLQAQPANAIEAAATKEGISASDLDVVEINEAFAAVGLASAKQLGLEPKTKGVVVTDVGAGTPAEQAGLKVVMNRCPKIEYMRLHGEIGWNGINSNVITNRKRPVKAVKKLM